MISTKQQLKDYCLRRLGNDVINIEISDDQLDDRVNDTLQKFVKRHYDGVTEVMWKHTVTLRDVENGYITVPSNWIAILEILRTQRNSSKEILDDVEYNMMYDIVLNKGGFWTLSDYYINMRHLTLIERMLRQDNAFEYNSITNRLYPRYNLSANATGNLLANGDDLTETEWNATNAVLTSNDVTLPNGDVEGQSVTSSGAGVFGFDQTIASERYVRGTYTGAVWLQAGTYTGDVTITMEDGNGVELDSTTVTLPTLWEQFKISDSFGNDAGNDVVFKVETVTAAAGAGEDFHVWNPYVYKNHFIVLHGYMAIDADEHENVFDDEWVKKYATAMIKQQWGANTKKYQGIQLPGGIEINGQQIYDEATEEINQLNEEFSVTYELPVDMMWE